jgi:hypothetical protein
LPKNYKVKRYYGRTPTSFRAKPRLITLVLVAALFAGLAYLGVVLYEPVYDFVMNLGKPVEASSLPEPPPSPAPEPEPAPSEPPPPPEPVFEKLKAAYVPHATAADPAALKAFLDGLSGAGINAVMVDIKNAAGDVLFNTANAEAKKWGLVAENAIDLAALKAQLESRGLQLAVKLAAFRDPKAASAGRVQYAITYQNSEFLWLDNSAELGGRPWLNPYSYAAVSYLRSLALEAADAGAVLIALENVQFPDNSGIYATFGEGAPGLSRADALKNFVTGLEEAALAKSARVAVWFSGTDILRTQGQENRYGGGIMSTAGQNLVLDVSPGQYGEPANSGGLVIASPATDPLNAVSSAVSFAKNALSPESTVIAAIRASGDIEAQIKAAQDAGAEEYIRY